MAVSVAYVQPPSAFQWWWTGPPHDHRETATPTGTTPAKQPSGKIIIGIGLVMDLKKQHLCVSHTTFWPQLMVKLWWIEAAFGVAIQN